MAGEQLTQTDALVQVNQYLPGLLNPHEPSFTTSDVLGRASKFRREPHLSDIMSITAQLSPADIAIYGKNHYPNGDEWFGDTETQVRLFAYKPGADGSKEWNAQFMLGNDTENGRSRLFFTWQGGTVSPTGVTTESNRFYMHFVDQGTSLSINFDTGEASAIAYNVNTRSHAYTDPIKFQLHEILDSVTGEAKLAEIYKDNHIKITKIEYAADNTIAISYTGYPDSTSTNTIILPSSLKSNIPSDQPVTVV